MWDIVSDFLLRTVSQAITKAGPPTERLVSRAGARVMSVPGLYCVSYLIFAEDGGVAIVDVGSSADFPQLKRALQRADASFRDIRMVIPSHLHCDHVAGMDRFARLAKAPLGLGRVAYDHVSQHKPLRFPSHVSSFWHLLGGWPLQGAPLVPPSDLINGRNFGLPWATNPFISPISYVLEDGEDLPGFKGWSVLATPGHSDDSIALYHADAGFLICGDTVRNFYGGEWNPLLTDKSAYSITKERLMALDVRAVFPGHGPIIEGERVLLTLQNVCWPFP